MKVTVGRILKELRIGSGFTLREFCMRSDLDPSRFSMVERDILTPSTCEVNEYLKLVNMELGGLNKAQIPFVGGLPKPEIIKDGEGFEIRISFK